MNAIETQVLELKTTEDVVRMRQAVRQHSVSLGFSLVDQTKLVTAASELGRNTIIHGGGGEMKIEPLLETNRRGLSLTFSDKGKGIPDVELALKDGYTTGSGMGLGLGGAKRLSSEFHIQSKPGEGTRITIKRWR
ncbi:MAG TPA: anti-sigma regulatory factor [Burkholderiales bacterium]|nr:anti-sigma regulatory factor [Burkholderiales bacterium]